MNFNDPFADDLVNFGRARGTTTAKNRQSAADMFSVDAGPRRRGGDIGLGGSTTAMSSTSPMTGGRGAGAGAPSPTTVGGSVGGISTFDLGGNDGGFSLNDFGASRERAAPALPQQQQQRTPSSVMQGDVGGMGRSGAAPRAGRRGPEPAVTPMPVQQQQQMLQGAPRAVVGIEGVPDLAWLADEPVAPSRRQQHGQTQPPPQQQQVASRAPQRAAVASSAGTDGIPNLSWLNDDPASPPLPQQQPQQHPQQYQQYEDDEYESAEEENDDPLSFLEFGAAKRKKKKAAGAHRGGNGSAAATASDAAVAVDPEVLKRKAEEEKRRKELLDLYASLDATTAELATLEDKLRTAEIKEEAELMELETTVAVKTLELQTKQEELEGGKKEARRYVDRTLASMQARQTEELAAQQEEVRNLERMRFERVMKQTDASIDETMASLTELRKRKALLLSDDPFGKASVKLALAEALRPRKVRKVRARKERKSASEPIHGQDLHEPQQQQTFVSAAENDKNGSHHAAALASTALSSTSHSSPASSSSSSSSSSASTHTTTETSRSAVTSMSTADDPAAAVDAAVLAGEEEKQLQQRKPKDGEYEEEASEHEEEEEEEEEEPAAPLTEAETLDRIFDAAVALLHRYCGEHLGELKTHVADFLHAETTDAAHSVRRARELSWIADAVDRKALFGSHYQTMLERYRVFYRERAALKARNTDVLLEGLRRRTLQLRADTQARLDALLREVTARLEAAAEAYGEHARATLALLARKSAAALAGDTAAADSQRAEAEQRALTESTVRRQLRAAQTAAAEEQLKKLRGAGEDSLRADFAAALEGARAQARRSVEELQAAVASTAAHVAGERERQEAQQRGRAAVPVMLHDRQRAVGVLVHAAEESLAQSRDSWALGREGTAEVLRALAGLVGAVRDRRGEQQSAQRRLDHTRTAWEKAHRQNLSAAHFLELPIAASAASAAVVSPAYGEQTHVPPGDVTAIHLIEHLAARMKERDAAQGRQRAAREQRLRQHHCGLAGLAADRAATADAQHALLQAYEGLAVAQGEVQERVCGSAREHARLAAAAELLAAQRSAFFRRRQRLAAEAAACREEQARAVEEAERHRATLAAMAETQETQGAAEQQLLAALRREGEERLTRGCGRHRRRTRTRSSKRRRGVDADNRSASSSDNVSVTPNPRKSKGRHDAAPPDSSGVFIVSSADNTHSLLTPLRAQQRYAKQRQQQQQLDNAATPPLQGRHACDIRSSNVTPERVFTPQASPIFPHRNSGNHAKRMTHNDDGTQSSPVEVSESDSWITRSPSPFIDLITILDSSSNGSALYMNNNTSRSHHQPLSAATGGEMIKQTD